MDIHLQMNKKIKLENIYKQLSTGEYVDKK